MIKTAMLAASLAALALAALPAIAAAEEGETNNPGDPVLTFKEGQSTAFTVANGKEKVATLTGTNGANTVKVTCQKLTGEGVFQDKGLKQETGSVKFIFHECKLPELFNIPCTTAGSPEGTITTTTLPFHLKKVVHEGEEKAGVLITPSEVEIHKEEGFVGTHFATFVCGFTKVEVGGPTTRETADGTKHKGGVIGTITSPPDDESVASNTATISFLKDPLKPHHQTHQKVKNDEHTYNLWSRVAGGATGTASEEAEGVITFEPGVEPVLGTTP